MKKVLIVCGKLCIGGAEKVAYSIGEYIDKEKYECHYIVFGDSVGEYEEPLIKLGCKIIHIKSPSFSYKLFCLELNNLMKETRYDIVHCHTMFNSGIVLSVAKHNDIACRIAHSHSICSSKNRKMDKRIYEKIMRFLILKTATHYVACGKKAGEWLFGKEIFEKYGTLILNGIDTGKFKYNENKRRKVRKMLAITNKLVIGHVGHLASVKNQKFLIELMPHIIKRNPDIMLVLVGEGDEHERLKKVVNELQLQNHVIFTGNVTNVQDYLSAMDVFVFPSLYEGMPLALIEVQANGLPCVVSDAVPKDVYLSDLIVTLSLEEQKNKWIETILNAKRINSERYSQYIYSMGLDTKMMVKKIQSIYEE